MFSCLTPVRRPTRARTQPDDDHRCLSPHAGRSRMALATARPGHLGFPRWPRRHQDRASAIPAVPSRGWTMANPACYKNPNAGRHRHTADARRGIQRARDAGPCLRRWRLGLLLLHGARGRRSRRSRAADRPDLWLHHRIRTGASASTVAWRCHLGAGAYGAGPPGGVCGARMAARTRWPARARYASIARATVSLALAPGAKNIPAGLSARLTRGAATQRMASSRLLDRP